MRFGFDIDDTLINLRGFAFQLYKQKLNNPLADEIFEQIPTVEIHAPFGLTNEQGGQMWKDNMEEIYFTDCPTYENALETLQGLAAAGHEIYYITSRPKAHCAKTHAWMVAKGFPVEQGHFFCGMQDHEKIQIIKDLQLDYYFDDKPAVLETLHDIQTTIVVADQSYNRHLDLPRLTAWSDFEKLLSK